MMALFVGGHNFGGHRALGTHIYLRAALCLAKLLKYPHGDPMGINETGSVCHNLGAGP